MLTRIKHAQYLLHSSRCSQVCSVHQWISNWHLSKIYKARGVFGFQYFQVLECIAIHNVLQWGLLSVLNTRPICFIVSYIHCRKAISYSSFGVSVFWLRSITWVQTWHVPLVSPYRPSVPFRMHGTEILEWMSRFPS